MDNYDLAVIGGGINGAGIAADAAGRGLRVALFEQADLGSATSSASTKLVHGGLRYLETWEFALVRKALKESQLLLELAPHLIQPVDIHLPYQKHLRPWLMIRAGLFLYNHLASRPSYPAARAVRFAPDSPLKSDLNRGFSFADGQVDDSRLVVLNAIQARSHGADVFVRHRCNRLQPGNDCWELTVADLDAADDRRFTARAVVNAGGPWVSSLFDNCTGNQASHRVRLVKGSHIVVPRVYPGSQAYMLQNEDGRIAFVIPYQEEFTMIGTTEAEFAGDPGAATISDREVDYLLEIFNSYFKTRLDATDIVNTWSGVRPLIDESDASATRASRDYRLVFEDTPVPLLSVYGGKLTTYRLLAEQAVDRLKKVFPDLGPSRTDSDCLPGGDFQTRDTLQDALSREYPWLDAGLLRRWIASYGTLTRTLLADCSQPADLGTGFGHGLSQREVDYLVDREWARTVDDILWRRTKLGLHFTQAEQQSLQAYLDRRPGGNSSSAEDRTPGS